MAVPSADNAALLDAVASPLLLIRDRQIIYANPAAARLLRSETTALLQRPLEEFLPPEAGRIPSTSAYTSRWFAADLTPLWVEYTITVVESEQVPAHLFSLRDLTEQQSVEATASRLQRILDSLPDPIYAKDIHHRFIYANHSFLKTARLGAFESVRGKTDDDLWGSEGAQQFRDMETALLHANVETVDFEHTTKKLLVDGQPKTYRVSKRVLRNESGTIDGLVGINHDVTQLHQQEIMLMEREAQFREAQKLARLGSFITDMPNGHEWWSDSLYAIYGVEPGAEPSIQLFRSVLHPADRDAVVGEIYDAVGSNASSYQFEHRIIQPATGQTRYVSCAVEIQRDKQGRADKLIGVVQDITDFRLATDSLREAQQFSNRVLTLMPDSVYVFDLIENRTVYDSRSIDVLLGYTAEQMAAFGPNVLQMIVHPDDFPQLMELINQYEKLADGQSIENEIRYKAADGSWRWLRTRSAVFSRTPEGRPHQIVGVSSDVTRAREQAEKIEQSELQYRLLADNIRDIIVVVGDDGRIEYVSPTIRTVLGIEPEEVVGRYPWDLLHPDEMLSMATRFADVAQFSETKVFREEVRARCKDGTYLICEAVSSVLKTGEHFKVIASLRDVRDRKLAEEALRQSEERLRFITDNMLDMVSVSDKDGRVLYATPSHERVLGYAPAELVGKPLMDHIHPDDLPVVATYFLEATAQSGPGSYQYRFRHAQGHYVWLETIAAATFNASGEIERTVFSSRAIGDRKAAEDALRSSEESARRFRDRLRMLHEISLELSEEDHLDELARKSVQWACQLLNIDRAGLFLRVDNGMTYRGTYGIDEQGLIRDEHHALMDLTDEQDFLRRGLEERIWYREKTDLYDEQKGKVGEGWHAAAFLKSQGQVIGVLPVDNLLTGRPLPPDDREVLALYAAVLGNLFARKLALDELRTNEESARRFRDHLKDLHHLNLELTELDDWDALTRRIVEGGRELLHLDRMALFITDPATNEICGTYGTNEQGETTDERHWRSKPLHEDMEAILRQNRGLIFRDDIDLCYDGKAVGRGWHATALLVSGSQPVGTLVADNLLTGNPLPPDDRELFALYAALLGALLTRKRTLDALRASEESVRRFRDRLKDLHRLNVELASLDDWDTLTRRIVEDGRKLLQVDRIALFTHDPQTNEKRGTFGTDMQGQTTDERQWRARQWEDEIETLAKSDRGLLINEDIDLYYDHDVVGRGWHAMAYLSHAGQGAGVLVADNAITNRPLSVDDRELMTLYVTMLGSLLVRKRTLDALRESEARYRMLAENANDVIWTIDLTGRFTYVSPSVERLRGYTPEEVMAESMESSLTPASYQVAINAFTQTLTTLAAGGRVPINTYELEQPCKDGTTVWTEVTTTGLYNERGETIGILGVTRNISERRQIQSALVESERLQAEIQKEQELSNLKTAMMLRISHEFRTPLSVILSSAEILDHYSERLTPQRRIDHLNKIRSHVNHLTSIIDAIQLSVQGIFNRLSFRPQPFDLPALCREVIVEQQSRFRDQRMVQLQISGENQPFSGDLNLVRLTLQNLLSNALKFSPDGEPVLVRVDIGPDEARIEVLDQGMGIPAAELERVFDPFFRASGIGEIPGLGIGLSIARDAVTAHRGDIKLERRPSGGTLARVCFPNSI